METGDVFVSPISVPDDFIAYVSSLGISVKKDSIYVLPVDSPNLNFVQSIIDDKDALQCLKSMSKEKSISSINALIESEDIAKLSELLELPLLKTDRKVISSGVIRNVNDKISFKGIARKLGLNVLTGFVSNDIQQFEAYVNTLPSDKKIIVKKPFAAGGFGNLFGAANDVHGMIKKNGWGSETLMTEEFINFEKVMGSITLLAEQITFRGVNEQMTESGRWDGFRYPSTVDEKIKNMIKNESLIVAEYLYNKGVRGDLNLDWGVINDDRFRRPVLLECNLRFNGFGIVFDFVSKYFGTNKKHILCMSNFNLHKQDATLEYFATKSAPYFIEGKNKKEGAFVIVPPYNGEVSIVIVADTLASIHKIREYLEGQFL